MLENTDIMANFRRLRLLFNIQMVADELENYGIKFDLRTTNGTPSLKEFNIFTKDTQLNEDTLYYVPQTLADKFNTDKYHYITNDDIDGKAPHISNIDADATVLINTVLSILQKFRDFESELNNVIVSNGSLLDLCKIGMNFFGNPLYVHDRNFTVLALPKIIPGMINFERNENENNYHIPLWLINEFKFDESYQKTFTFRSAAIWGTDQYPHNIRSLYVNLFDQDFYYGRVLVNEIESPLKPGQFRLLEYFANYATLIIKRDSLSASHYYKDYEDTIKGLVRGNTDSKNSDLLDFLRIKGWNEDDELICIKFKTQDDKLSIHSDAALRSVLVSEFAGCFDFYYNQRLCLIINISKTGQRVSDIRSILAGLVRDSYMYVGISNYTKGIRNIYAGFKQTDFVLEYIEEHPQQWLMMFFECSLEYLLKSIKTEIDIKNVVSPYLQILIDHDKEFGTEYYKTLRSYIINERNIPETSKDLVIHRTTLTHRLEQIEKLIKHDLSNEDTRLYLLLSFRLFER